MQEILPILLLGGIAIVTVGAVTYGVSTDVVDNIAGTANPTQNSMNSTLIILAALALTAVYLDKH
jgi:hypothetical protein